MYRLLVVDDEPIIVDGMYQLLQAEEELALDVYRAYSGDEALEKLNAMRYDIVLSDIRMPGMSGLELQQHINDRWPACKVIFLTGHPDFEYVQTAMRNKSVDYILKTENDREVLRSVRKAIEMLNAERLNASFLDKAAEQLRMAIPSLQREILLSVCEGTKPPESLRPELLRDLYIPLALDDKVLLVVGRVDRWPDSIANASDKALMMFAIHNIAEENLASCSLQAVNLDHNRFMWLLQPGAQPPPEAILPEEQSLWGRTIRLVHGTLELIQSTSLELLRVPVSMAAGKAEAEWRDLPACYEKLRTGLGRGLGIGQETIIIEDRQPGDYSLGESEMQKQSIRNLLRKWTGTGDYFEAGDEQEMSLHLTELAGRLDPFYEETGFFLEVYYAIASCLLAQMNRRGEHREKLPDVQMDMLSHYQLHPTRRDAFHYLIHAALRLFEARDSEKLERTNQVVETLNRYVEEHLDADLSLTTLSEIVHLNPYYMSRLYKQITGVNLPDYIAEERIRRAKELAAASHLKMHEISRTVGFESPAYFTRIFKKKTGFTPQEYRDHHRTNRI
jgi:two-component system response regulator YesN